MALNLLKLVSVGSSRYDVSIPILYSFRRCPYAIRARMAIHYAAITVEHREVSLRNKPVAMLHCSPKGTVPVLQLNQDTVIDESLEIMHWALSVNDSKKWLNDKSSTARDSLLEWNDGEFKYYLDRYKYADRYPEYPVIYYRQKAERFLHELEQHLTQSNYLLGKEIDFADVAIMPFVRQFSKVDEHWFQTSQYSAVRTWLNQWINSSLFLSVMEKHPVWIEPQLHNDG